MNAILTHQEKALKITAHIILGLFCAMAIIPFWLLIASSFSDSNYAIREGYHFVPRELSVNAYQCILREADQIGRAYVITILVTAIGTSVGILISSALAYGLAQKNVAGTGVITALILFTMLFSGGVVPQYMIYSNLLHFKNTLLGLIVPNLLTNGFSVFLIRNYIRSSIPGELSEAMEIDGAGPLKIYRRLILPLSTPILATAGVMSAVTYWNDWKNGLYYITDARLYSVQHLLSEMNNNVLFLVNNASDPMLEISVYDLPTATMRMAIAVIGILPILIAYPFFQKYFAKGITIGAVKG